MTPKIRDQMHEILAKTGMEVKIMSCRNLVEFVKRIDLDIKPKELIENKVHKMIIYGVEVFQIETHSYDHISEAFDEDGIYLGIIVIH